MPDHWADELDRWEVDILDAEDEESLRNALRAWLGQAPSPFQIETAKAVPRRYQEIAQSLGFTVTTTRLREGTRIVPRASLRDARGRFIARGTERVKNFLREAGF